MLTGGHVGHGEVHGGLPDGGDAHVDDGHVRLLCSQVRDHPRPPPVLEAAVAATLHQVELVLELDLLGELLQRKLSVTRCFPLVMNELLVSMRQTYLRCSVLCVLGKLFKYYNILSRTSIVTAVTIHILHNSRKEKESF